MLLFSMMSADVNPYESFSAGLDTRFVGRKIIYFPQLSSTMDIARREAWRGAAVGTVIIAGEQTGGRGRLKRRWLSPPGNIALSVILYPGVSQLPYLVIIASLAAVHGIESVTGLKTDIKWPNDILIGGKKVGGILIENEVKAGRVGYAIIGIGININVEESQIEGSSLPVTSLEKETRRVVVKADVIRSLLVEMERLYLLLPDGEAIYRAWREKLVTLGKRVIVQTGTATLEGLAESVDSSGALTLRLDDGRDTIVFGGDVTLRKK